MMSEKRFKLSKRCGSANTSCILDEQGAMLQGEVVNLLNSLWEENEQLRKTIKEMQQDERLYAKEIVKLNKEAKEVLNFKELGGDY